jgi:hypothetical protein
MSNYSSYKYGMICFVWMKVCTVVKYELLTSSFIYDTYSLQGQDSIPKCKPPLQTLFSSYWEAYSFYSSGVICMKLLAIFALKSPMPMGNCSYIIFFTGPSLQTNEWQWVQQIWRESSGTIATIPAVLNVFSRNTPTSNKCQSASPFQKTTMFKSPSFSCVTTKFPSTSTKISHGTTTTTTATTNNL